MSRAQHDQMVRQGLVNQGQMPLRMLQPPGIQQQRPVLPPPQQLNRYRNSRKYMSHFSYSCKTERQNGISHLISELCVP